MSASPMFLAMARRNARARAAGMDPNEWRRIDKQAEEAMRIAGVYE